MDTLSPLPVAIFAGVVAYCVISMLAGQAGLIAQADLRQRISEMKVRIERLESDNLALRTASESLRFDSDRIAREARDLGFIRPGEKIIVLSNLPVPESVDRPIATVREVLAAGVSSGLPDRVVKILALVTGLAVLGATWIMSLKPRRSSARADADADADAA